MELIRCQIQGGFVGFCQATHTMVHLGSHLAHSHNMTFKAYLHRFDPLDASTPLAPLGLVSKLDCHIEAELPAFYAPVVQALHPSLVNRSTSGLQG